MPRFGLPVLVLSIGAVLARTRPPWSNAPEEQVVAVAWVLAVALWSWLVVVGTVHAWATRTGRLRWARVTTVLLPAGVRRRVEQVAVAGLLVLPVAACTDGPDVRAAPVLVLEGTIPLSPSTSADPPGSTSTTSWASTTTAPSTSVTTTTAPTTTAPTTTAPITAAPDAGGPATPVRPGGSEPEATPGANLDDMDRPDLAADPTFDLAVDPGARVVVRGDTLWGIAAAHLAEATGRDPDVEEIRAYWVEVVEENRWRLASGDPDLIHPGEVVQLPPLG